VTKEYVQQVRLFRHSTG